MLMQDKNGSSIFNNDFTPQKFVDLVFSLILASLLQQDYDSFGIVSMINLVL